MVWQEPSDAALEFLLNEAGEDEGLGHAGIETYRDDPYASVAREVGQNSRDAADTLPVRLSFDLLEVPAGEIPALGKFREAVDCCLQKASASGNAKGLAFFAQAKATLAGSHLKILRISDLNTTGLRGPAESGTPFHSLVKGSGVGLKMSESSGGSFGIGKNAAYAVSDIQAVFYSTIYESTGTKERRFLAQGKAVLISHTDLGGQPLRAHAYWGRSAFRPFDDMNSAPPWLRRDEVGTSMFIMGFRETPDWQKRNTCSLIQNFFHAVHQREMEFSINCNSIRITKGHCRRASRTER